MKKREKKKKRRGPASLPPTSGEWRKGLATTLVVLFVGGAFLLAQRSWNAERALEAVTPAPPVAEDLLSTESSSTSPPRRPQKWLNEPRPFRPTAEGLEGFAQTIRASGTYVPTPSVPVEDRVILEKLQAAQRLVAAHDPVAGMWRGAEVQAVVAEFGNRIPFIHVPGGASPDGHQVYMGYNPQGVLAIGTRVTQAYSVSTLAALLVHEATHAVFLQLFLDRTGLSLPEFMKMISWCRDINLIETFSTEALAYANQQVWCDLPEYTSDPCHPDVLQDMRTIRAARQDPDALTTFAKFMRSLAYARRNQPERDAQGTVMGCGPPIVQRGPDVGTFFFPSDIAPGYLVPLLDAVAD